MLACVCHPSRAHNLPRPLEPVHRPRPRHAPAAHASHFAHDAYSTSVFDFITYNCDNYNSNGSGVVENGKGENEGKRERTTVRTKRTNSDKHINNNNNEKTIDKNRDKKEKTQERKEKSAEKKEKGEKASPTMKSKSNLERKKSVEAGSVTKGANKPPLPGEHRKNSSGSSTGGGGGGGGGDREAPQPQTLAKVRRCVPSTKSELLLFFFYILHLRGVL